MKSRLAFLLLFVAIIAGGLVASVQSQKKKEEKKHRISFVYLDDKDTGDVNDIWLRIEYEAGVRLIKVKHLTAFAFFPDEDSLRNEIFFTGGKVETNADYDELVEAIRKAEMVLGETETVKPK